MKRGYIDTAQGQIHYRRQTGSGLPLALLHQTPSSSAMYEALMEALAGEYDMIALDTPGFGGSDAPHGEVSIAVYAETLYTALQGLGVQACRLFGHHTGAAIAVQMAHDHPEFVRQLALSGPPYLRPGQKAALRENLPDAMLYEDGRHLLTLWQRLRDKNHNAPLNLTLREILSALQAAENYAAAYIAVSEHDFEGQLAALACPVLVMAGERDSLRGSLEAAYSVLRQGTMRVLADADTYVCDLRAEAVAGALREFFGGAG
ncbi:MAG: alpha/beta hydrolase [Chloroflexi bacterium]|nr:alpha/beta hydrolase [Chloroflexota bacterium]